MPVTWQRSLLVFGALLLLVGLAYGNSLGNELVWDRHLIDTNSLIRDLRNLPVFFVSDYWAGTDQPLNDKRYRPLVVTTFALNYAAGGLDPLGYHLVNLLLHFAVTWLVYSLGLEIGLPFFGAVAAAALYAVHPMHTEVILAIGNRTEMMMALGVLSSLWFAARGMRWFSIAAFGLALLSKEQAAITPVLLVLLGMSRSDPLSNRSSWRSLLEVARKYGAHFVLLGIYIAARLWLFGKFQPPQYPYHLDPLEHVYGLVWFSTVLKCAGQYLWVWIWPMTLRTDYSFETIPLASSIWEAGVLWAVIAWGGLLALAIWFYRRDRRVVFCVGLTTTAFLPVSNFLVPIGSPMGERLFYLPSAGLCLLAGLGLSALAIRYASHSKAAIALSAWPLRMTVLIAGLICLVLLGRTMIRNQDWTTDELFARSMARDAPRSAKAHAFLGDFLENSSRPHDWAEALEQYQTALTIYPEYFRTDSAFADSLGFLFLKMGRWEEAVVVLEQAIQLSPQWSVPYYHLGRVYALRGSAEGAEELFRRSLDLQDDMEVRTTFSRFLIDRGRVAEALAHAEHVVEKHPDYALALYSRALALEGLNRNSEAESAYRSVLAHDLPPSAQQEISTRLELLRKRLAQNGQDAANQ